MSEDGVISDKARAFFEDIWKRGDFWQLETSGFEAAKYARQFTLLQGRRYSRVLEIGCGSGCFTRLLADIADYVVALDVSPTAIEKARSNTMGLRTVDFCVANIMNFDVKDGGPWDLVVMSETIYYLGWLYSVFDVAWLAVQLFEATGDNGLLLMANTCGGIDDHRCAPGSFVHIATCS